MTEAGYLHRAQGLYGKSARLSRPARSPAANNPLPSFRGEHPLARPIVALRRYHTEYRKKGCTRVLIPLCVVRLDHDADQPLTPAAHRELFEAFIGAAPAAPRRRHAAHP